MNYQIIIIQFIMLNPLAQELNESLKGTSAEALFSDLGKRIYFPKGIIAQGGEAKQKASVANGTIGTTVINGKPAILPSVQKWAPELSSGELVAYAPTAGLPAIREAWKQKHHKQDKKHQYAQYLKACTAANLYQRNLHNYIYK